MDGYVVNWHMRRGLLQDYANQVCQKAAGWLMTLDESLLITLGTGTITVDLLSGRVCVNGQDADGPLKTYTEVAGWIHNARIRDGLAPEVIQAFVLTVVFEVEERLDGAAQIRSVKLRCTSELTTAERRFAGSRHKSELWTRSGPTAVWSVRDA